jgi:putative membrane protein
MASAERVLTTPLPVGYNILISQIVLLYVYLLPFQLVTALGWIAIPATIVAAYMILGLATVGNQLEDPFGDDVNDLPLDHYCDELRRELDVLTSSPRMKFSKMIAAEEEKNPVLWPLSMSGHDEWRQQEIDDIRNALKSKVVIGHARPAASGKPSSQKSMLKTSRVSSGVTV